MLVWYSELWTLYYLKSRTKVQARCFVTLSETHARRQHTPLKSCMPRHALYFTQRFLSLVASGHTQRRQHCHEKGRSRASRASYNSTRDSLSIFVSTHFSCAEYERFFRFGHLWSGNAFTCVFISRHFAQPETCTCVVQRGFIWFWPALGFGQA